MSNDYMVGLGPSVVKRFLLTEGSGFTMPPKASLLYSEVVTNDDGEEILEVWLAVATSAEQTGYHAPRTPKTIFSKTSVVDDEEYEYDEFDPEADDDVGMSDANGWASQEHTLRRKLEAEVTEKLESEEETEYYEH